MTKENIELLETAFAPEMSGGGAPAKLTLAPPRAIDLNRVATRREHDLLGEAEVPADVYWGIHTLRAVENFPITGVPIGHFPELIRALALVKQAAARANRRLSIYRRKRPMRSTAPAPSSPRMGGFSINSWSMPCRAARALRPI